MLAIESLIGEPQGRPGAAAQAAQGVAELLTGAGYVVADIARALTDVFNQTAAEVASVLRTVGYAIADITRVLDDVFAQTVDGVASILKSIVYTVNEIGSAQALFARGVGSVFSDRIDLLA